MEKFSNHNKFEYVIKISKNNFGYNPKQKLLTVPMYFVPFISQDLANEALIDLKLPNVTEA